MNDILKSVGVDWHVLVAQFMSFLILLFVITKFLYRPIDSILQQRREIVENEMEDARVAKLKAEEAQKASEARLAGIADEARQRLEQALKEAEAARQAVLDQAQNEVRELRQRAHDQMTLDRDQLRRELRAEMADLVAMATERTLRRQLTPTIQSAVIDDVIRELDAGSRN